MTVVVASLILCSVKTPTWLFAKTGLCVQFIDTMEANIMAKLNTVANVTITKVSPGSINVANSVASTGAENNMAKANQDAFASLLGSPDGVSCGAVTVSNVTKTTSPNPSEFSSRLHLASSNLALLAQCNFNARLLQQVCFDVLYFLTLAYYACRCLHVQLRIPCKHNSQVSQCHCLGVCSNVCPLHVKF